MGMLDDVGRILDASKNNPRPGLAEGLSKAADAAEQAKIWQQQGAPAGATAGAPGFNPFENAAAYSAAIPGSGVVTSLTDTGQKFDTATIYDVGLDVTLDGQAPYPVVHRQMIAAAALGNWQPGKVITLRVDPQDKTKVMLG
jgi:hypothetical protein